MTCRLRPPHRLRAQADLRNEYDANSSRPGCATRTYLIDGRGRRVGRLVDGVVDAYWVYQDALNPVAQLDASGDVEQLYVYANLPHVPALIVEPGGRTLRVVTDQVGSVRRIVDTADGTVVQSIDYSPFGVIEAESATGGFDQPFRFAGGLWDADTEFIRFGARDYDPRVGRWTAKDPIGFGGGTGNLYEYGHAGPTAYIDVDGRLPILAWLAAAAVSAIISAALDFGIQAIHHRGNLRCIDWTSVGISAAVGAVSVGLGWAVRAAKAPVQYLVGALGNAGLGAGSQVARNASRGEELSDGVGAAATWGGVFGAAGTFWNRTRSGITEAIGRQAAARPRGMHPLSPPDLALPGVGSAIAETNALAQRQFISEVASSTGVAFGPSLLGEL